MSVFNYPQKFDIQAGISKEIYSTIDIHVVWISVFNCPCFMDILGFPWISMDILATDSRSSEKRIFHIPRVRTLEVSRSMDFSYLFNKSQ